MKLLGKIVPSPDLTKVEVTLEADCKETQQARKGDKVTVHYGGFLQDGEITLEDLNEQNYSQQHLPAEPPWMQ